MYSQDTQDCFLGGQDVYLEGDVCDGERIETKSLAQEDSLQLKVKSSLLWQFVYFGALLLAVSVANDQVARKAFKGVLASKSPHCTTPSPPMTFTDLVKPESFC